MLFLSWGHLPRRFSNVQVEKYPLLNNKPALMRAYKQTTQRDGDGDAWVERPEFPSLLRNLVYFNKLFAAFDDVDGDDDRRLTLAEFRSGCVKVGLKVSTAEVDKAFASMDTNGGGKVLFDEFCAWVAETACPVDGEVVRTYTTTSDPIESKPAKKAGAAKAAPAAAAAAAKGGKSGIATTKFDAVEKEFRELMGNPARIGDLNALWDRIDFNDNQIVSLAEIDKLIVRCFLSSSSYTAGGKVPASQQQAGAHAGV
jgi:hypothetical protein